MDMDFYAHQSAAIYRDQMTYMFPTLKLNVSDSEQEILLQDKSDPQKKKNDFLHYWE